eukprot:TRINITY_DN5940_c0_g1_i3.p1 TRINITY_DN5940_c0_g1~~TRINITY_DN5940_c0_g1_i3.p1  ORF type:complete len:1045 (+),score=270.45 TRINITY_DN5940_c0_g1_i3:37-3171(+)
MAVVLESQPIQAVLTRLEDLFGRPLKSSDGYIAAAVGAIAIVYAAWMSPIAMFCWMAALGIGLTFAIPKSWLRFESFLKQDVAVTIPRAKLEKHLPPGKTADDLIKGGCKDCGMLNCSRSRPRQSREVTHPWEGLMIPHALNEVAEEFVERLIRDFLYFWYEEMTDNVTFIDDLKLEIRYLVASLLRRASVLDINSIVMEVALPQVDSHLRLCLHALQELRANEGEGSEASLIDNPTLLHKLEAALLSDGKIAHPSLGYTDATQFNAYLRNMAVKIMPCLFRDSLTKAPLMATLMREMLITYALRPTVDSLAYPDFFNYTLELALLGPYVEYDYQQTSPLVELLSVVIAQDISGSKPHTRNLQSALKLKLADVLLEPEKMMQLMKYCKQTETYPLLAFVLDVDMFVSNVEPMRDNPDKRDFAWSEASRLLSAYLSAQAAHPQIYTPPEQLEVLRNKLAAKEGWPGAGLFADLYNQVYTLMDGQIFQEYLQSDFFFNTILGSKASKPKTPRVLRKGRDKAVTKAELEAMNLPPPPSATIDPHEAQLVKEKKRFLRRNKESKEPKVDMDDIEQRHRTQSLREQKPASSDKLLANPGPSIPEEEVRTRAMTSVVSTTSESASPVETAPPLLEVDEEGPEIKVAAVPEDALKKIRFRMKEPVRKGRPPKTHVAYPIEIIVDSSDKGASQVLYTKESGNCWVIERRYSEFHTLDKIVKKFYPENVPLPSKKPFGKLNADLTAYRRQALGQYLQTMLDNQLMHTDDRCRQAIYWFLNDDEDGNYQKLIQQHLTFWTPAGKSRKAVPRRAARNQMSAFARSFAVTTQALEKDRVQVMAAQQLQVEANNGQEGTAYLSDPALLVRPVCMGPDAPPITQYSKDAIEKHRDAYLQQQSKLSATDAGESHLDLIHTLLEDSMNPMAHKLLVTLSQQTLTPTIKELTERFIQYELDCLLSEPALIDTLKGTMASIFTPDEVFRSPEVQEETKRKVMSTLLAMIPNLPSFVGDSDKLKRLVGDLFGLLQSEALNRQLVMILLDDILVKLFPELVHDA